MLFNLCIEPARVAGLNEAEVTALENIGMECFYGHHLVVSTRPALEALVTDHRLSRSSKAAYVSVLANAAETDALLRRISRRVDVTMATGPSKAGPVWTVPLRILGESDIVRNRPEILAEHISDARFYYCLGWWYWRHSKLRGFTFFADVAGGGGDNVHGELDNCANIHPRVVFCIVDSDRAYPEAAIGQTARKCIEKLKDDKWHAHLEILSVRAAENLLPVPWVRYASRGNGPSTEALELLDSIHECAMTFLQNYCNVKRGFTICELLKSEVGEIRLLTKTDLSSKVHPFAKAKTCAAQPRCTRKVCCLKFEGLGGDTLAQVTAWLPEAREEQTAIMMKDPRIAQLAKTIFEWGVSSEKRRA